MKNQKPKCFGKNRECQSCYSQKLMEDCEKVSALPVKGFKTKRFEFLSNFYESHFWFEGKIFESVEQCYQVLKCTNDEDRKKLFSISDPRKLKRMSKKIKVREDWDKIKLEVMVKLVYLKFSTTFFDEGELKNDLLDTGSRYLEETNWWGDEFWGVNRETRVGKNYLGKILMEVREELKQEEIENGTYYYPDDYDEDFNKSDKEFFGMRELQKPFHSVVIGGNKVRDCEACPNIELCFGESLPHQEIYEAPDGEQFQLCHA